MNSPRKRQGLILFSLLIVFALVLSACGAPAAPDTGAADEAAAPAEGGDEAAATGRGAGGDVKLLLWQAVSILNPYLSGGTKDIMGGSVVLEPLASYAPDGVMVPRLATEIPTLDNGGVAEDLMSITWKLRDDVIWSDDTPFTAADVVFSGEYCLNEEMGCAIANNFADVESVEAVDDYTVKISFSVPKPFPYGPFVGATTPVLQAAQFADCTGAKAQECSEQNFGPIGTGAYKVSEFRANDTVVYEINENYRDADKPFFARVVIKGGGDAASAARAVLETGEADYAWNLQLEPQILNDMEAKGLGTVEVAFGPAVERLIVNFTNPDPDLGDKRSEWTADDPNPHPFLADFNVRKALSLAVDRTTIAEQLYGAAGTAGCNIVPNPPAVTSPNNDDCVTQDIDAANALLDEGGYVDTDGDGVRETPDGVPMKILYQTSVNRVRQSTQALVKQWWAQIGVEAELKSIDAGVFFGGDPSSPDTYGKLYADIEMFTNTWDGTDPSSYMGNWRCEEISRAENQWLGGNIPRWCSEEYDALYTELTETADPAARNELIIQLNDLIVQDYAMIPLVTRGDVDGIINTLGGFEMNTWDSKLWNIADWYRTE